VGRKRGIGTGGVAVMTASPPDPNFAARVRDSFDRQQVMHFIGAVLTRVEAGLVEIELPYRAELTQQHGFFHAGIVSTIADSAGGYAAFTMMPSGSSVLTVEYKINMIAPANGQLLRAAGHVIKSGRTLVICELHVAIVKEGAETLCAVGTQTLICLPDRSDRPATE
jgi:uncharacterized protein (TIGR00369 family)